MNTIEAITQTALNRYNRLFDNQQYTVIAEQLVTDIRSNRDSVRVADAMNLVLCGIKNFLSRRRLGPVLFLHHFAQPG